MIPAIRKAFNENFTEEKYQAYLRDLNSVHPDAIEFRVCETPVFVPRSFSRKMEEACEHIIDLIIDPNFKKLTDRAIPADIQVPGETSYSDFIAFDFGICENESGELEPQLVEMQGFPTIFAYQVLQADMTRKHFDIPAGFDCYTGKFDRQLYLQLLKEIIVSDCLPEEVILLEVLPEQQKTRIDFYCTEDFTGIKTVSLTDLYREGRNLYYDNEGTKTRIKRIYNRVIFDDLAQQSQEVRNKGEILFEDLDVQWVPHPDWFYRISKFTLPFIRHPYVPPTFFLNEIKQLPAKLADYVLKPLFSFAGQGVIIDLKEDDIQNIKDPENWILQRKVKYADVILTPDVPAKAEIRLFYFWKKGDSRPVCVNNLARLSKGKMIGVRYNQEKTWVGGSLCFFEK
jgi:hypothetical protein